MDMIAEEMVATRAFSLTADTTAETKSAVVDTAGFEEFIWLVDLGDVDAAAVLALTVKENTANSTTSPTPTAVNLSIGDVAGAVTGVITTGALVLTESSGNLDNKLIEIAVDQNMLTKQYVFLSITATVESYEVNSGLCLKCRPRRKPVTITTDVVSQLVVAA